MPGLVVLPFTFGLCFYRGSALYLFCSLFTYLLLISVATFIYTWWVSACYCVLLYSMQSIALM